MLAAQPYDTLPRLTDPDLHGAWLNRLTKGGKDYSPDGYDMARVGKPIDERVGVTFDGAADYLRRAEANWRGGDSQGTISAWVKRDVVGVQHIAFASSDEAGGNHHFSFGITAGNLARVVFFETPVLNEVRGSTILLADQWYHIALISNGVLWSIFVNGELETLSVPSGVNDGSWFSSVASRNNVTVGVLRTSGISNLFNGSIKDVRYYSRVLTIDKIKSMYQAGVPDDSLVLHVHDGTKDLTRFERSLTRLGGIIVGHAMEFDGTDDKIDCGDLGNIQTIKTWINPNTTGEQILQIDTNKYIHIVAGTVTYVGVTPVATYVNAVVGTTLVADLWQHLVCVIEQTDANNFELAYDGSNYGEIDLRDVQVFDEVKSIDWVTDFYNRTRKFY